MSKVDSELEAALAESDAIEEQPVVKPAPEEPSRPRKKTSPALALALLAMVGGIVAFVMVGLTNASAYAVSADQAVDDAEKLSGRKLRVEGELVPGTLDDKTPCDTKFMIRSNDKQLPVHYKKCELPDTFRDRPEGGVLVTVEGELKDGTFQASLVMAKCTSKYEAEAGTYDPKTHEIVMPDGSRVKAPAPADSSGTIR